MSAARHSRHITPINPTGEAMRINHGMTLRDYSCGSVLWQAHISSTQSDSTAKAIIKRAIERGVGADKYRCYIWNIWSMADAMLAERDK